MQRLVIILILGGLNLISSAQSCIPDYITFYLQSQVDSFQINYPGCTEIEGDVIITGNDITNLIGLVVLTSIGGDLRIEDASSLTKLYGLNNISFIGGELNIEENESLFNLEGLSSLVHINESLKIKENSSLLSLSGLDNLTTIGEDLNIGCSGYSWTGNPLLNNLSGLHSLSSIGNTLMICNNHGMTDLSGIENLTSVENIRISSNDNQSSLTGLQGVTNVDGYISISWNDLLNSLYGLNNLTTTGSLLLFRLPSLDDLSGLERLCTVGNDLTISSNFSIISLTSLDSLNYIGGKLTIESNYDLVDLSGLENLTEIGAGLEIGSNYSLSSINALSSVTSIGGDLIIQSNSDLTSLVGLSGVTSIDGDLVISNFSNLTSLAGIENINPSSIENLQISWLYSLTDCAFPNICEYLADPNGVVDIYRNGSSCNNPVQIANECGITLPCLPYGNYHFMYQYEIDSFQTDYPGCTDLEGSLYIHGGWGGGMGDYTNLDGLSVVTSIDGILLVSRAYYLTSLSGIENIDGTSISDLYIWYSPYLSECEVQSICDYLANPNGEVEIKENANGCNSPEEVLDACESVSVQEQETEPLFKIFPNPASDYLYVDNQSRHEIDKILIYNTIGQIIYSQDYNDPVIHISDLDQGIYILEIIADDIKKRMKFIVGN
ncbi:MAG: T9SS type A sorting domain-containing protein [Bacteroidetes bacterium]|nr:T9SS type A sorting domain-containing protein [Bacteroidota bacterium]